MALCGWITSVVMIVVLLWLLGNEGDNPFLGVDGDCEPLQKIPPQEALRLLQVGVVSDDQERPRTGLPHLYREHLHQRRPRRPPPPLPRAPAPAPPAPPPSLP